MIRFQRSIHTTRNKNLEAIQWAKEIADYVNGKQPNYKVQAFSLRFGDINTIVWQADFEDLAALDKYQQFFGADKGYWEVVSKAEGLFSGDETIDTIFETL